MKITSTMTQNVAVVSIDATVQDAAAVMFAENVGMLPVDDHGRVVGVVTDRDIVTRAVAAGEHPRQASVRSVMTPEVHYVREDSSIEQAVEMMSIHRVRRLPVLDREKHLVGLLSLSDLSSESGVAAEALKALSHHHDTEFPR